MTADEANKIIAEYMEDKNRINYIKLKNGELAKMLTVEHLKLAHLLMMGEHQRPMYSESLDQLIPIWDKMNQKRVTLEDFGILKGYYGSYSADLELSHNYESGGKTIQEAAAIATAKAIKALEE